ncbi:MAG: M12 family metallopeptidase [Verrucomicrobiota bacterium]
MKTPFCRLGAVWVVIAASLAPVRAQNNTWDISQIDRILAAVPAGQSTATVGDMQILVSNLRAWRAQLTGEKSAFDGTIPTWTGGNVYYNFDGSVTPAHQKVFLDCAAEWATFANLHFILRTTQSNYITVQQQMTSGEGGHSAVGMVGGQQFLAISDGAWNHPTLCHEIGHALGLVHEHQRSDRDSYVTIFSANIIPGAEGNFVKLGNSQNKTAYDFLSVMHYYRAAFSANTLDTIEPLPAYVQYLDIMGSQFDPVLSASDRAGMATVYGAGPVLTPVVTNTLDSGPGSLRAALYYAFDHPGTTVSFNIPVTDTGYSNQVFNIQPSDKLPSLVHATTLDGGTEPTNSNPAGPEILLNGARLPYPDTFANGLRLAGTNCTVRSVIISGFNAYGLVIDTTNATGNVVAGCFLGVDPSGTIPATNRYNPVEIQNGASSNLIGGTTAAARNVISGSAIQGVVLRSGSRNNQVAGNFIGLNATGTAALANTWSGIEIFEGASNNVVGGTAPGSGNYIAGNGNYGVLLHDTGTVGNSIQGNFIGNNPSGAAVSNTWSGVGIRAGAQSTLVGGLTAGARNVISGNGLHGVEIGDAGTGYNTVQGNYIGISASGLAALGNGWSGVSIFYDSPGNLVGGTAAGAGNVISANGNNGVGISEPGSSNNIIQGNLLGLNAAGNAALGNTWAGVALRDGATRTLVGGSAPGAGNVISGNLSQGVAVGDANTTANTIAGNLIGLNPAGNSAIPNAWSGVEFFYGAQANLVGGGPGSRNVISGNGNYGVLADGYSAGNIIQGNTIGLNASASAAIPNTFSGVSLFDGAHDNQVGGASPAAANLVAGNSDDGIQLFDATTTNNAVRANSIYGNGGNSLALYSSANQSAAPPALASATVGTNTVVTGSLASLPNTVFHIDYFASPPPVFSIQAKTWLGSADATTGAGGNAGLNATLGPVPAGWILTATATDPSGNTSPLSGGVTVAATDSVGDGIPNAWRSFRFGGTGTTTNSQSCAACDPDQDGLSNYQEFLAGTNPTHAASTIKLSVLGVANPDVTLGINSAPGVVCRVEARTDLAAGSWTVLADQLIGNGGTVSLVDPGAGTLGRRFYRLDVLP